MSIGAMTWVIEHSKQKASSRFVLMMIANHAHSDGTGSYPSIPTLARECGMSERQIKRTLPELEASGELVVFWSKGRKPHEYAIPMGETNSDILSLLKSEHLERHDDANSDKLSPLTVTECHGSNDATVTFEHPNRDISVTPTVTFGSKNDDHTISLESLREPLVEKTTRPTKPTKAQERLKTRPDLGDSDFLSHLAALSENRGIAVPELHDRMIAWCVKKREQPSRLRLLKWIDNERAAVPIEIAKSRIGSNGNGHRNGFHTPDTQDEPPTRILKPRRPADESPPEHRAVWAAVCDFLRTRVDEDVYQTWFGTGVVFDGLNESCDALKVRAGQVTHDWITLYYSELVYDALTATGLGEFTLEWEIEQDEYEEQTI